MKRRLLSLLLISIYIVSIALFGFTRPTFATDLEMPIGETPSGIGFNDLEKTIDNYVSKYIGKTSPGAAISIVKDGQIIFSKGYGYADIENQIPVDPKNTVFEWASMSKLFTWTSVMQLVEDGKLDLDTNIDTYLSEEFVNKLNLKQNITLRDIMNHSAGFGDYAFNTVAFSPDKLVSLEEAILRDQPKQYYEVGTASAYSNYATSIAGYIVQNVSNQVFEDYERQNIFDILSMDNTSSYSAFNDNKAMIDLKAKGYLPDQNGGFELGHWSYISHSPAGSINGTAEDFAQYAIALTPANDEDSPLFKDIDTLRTMLSPSYDVNGELVGTSHGFFEYVGEYRTLGHGGNTAAFSSQFAFVPEERFGMVILTNAGFEMNILFGLHDLLLGKKDAPLKSSRELLPSSKDVVGQYVPMQRQEGNFIDFAKYISLYKVNTTDKENEIIMSMGAYNATYLQTKPYYYELVDDNIPIFRNAYPILRFRMANDRVEQIVVGHGLDLSKLPPGRTIPLLYGSVTVVLASILFFFIAPVILLIMAIKNRKAQLNIQSKKFNLYHSILIMCGTVTLINNLIPTAKIMINNFRTFAEMKPYILLNYPLLIGTVIVSIISFTSMKKTLITRKRRVMYLLTIIMLIVLFILLVGWNYFAIVG